MLHTYQNVTVIITVSLVCKEIIMTYRAIELSHHWVLCILRQAQKQGNMFVSMRCVVVPLCFCATYSICPHSQSHIYLKPPQHMYKIVYCTMNNWYHVKRPDVTLSVSKYAHFRHWIHECWVHTACNCHNLWVCKMQTGLHHKMDVRR